MLRFRTLFFIAAILSTIFVISQKNSLTSSKDIGQKNSEYESSLADDFVTYSMVRYSGIYTLFGVKPITEIDTQYQPPTEEERKYIYEGLSDAEKKEIPYKDFILKSPWGNSTKKQWKSFKSRMKDLDLKDYFFVETCYDYEDKEFNSLLFIHRPSLIRLLDRYHTHFEKELGEKFNTIEKISELKNGGSSFWDKIFKEKNHYLMGLVLGFGEKNSRCFDEESNGKKELLNQRIEHTSLIELRKILKEDISIEDLCIPQFISYQEEDEVVEDYRLSRKNIIQKLKNKNLTQEVFAILERGVSP